MKVLYIVGGEGKRYGSEIIAIDLISAGKKHGIEYIVVTASKGAVSDACEQLGIENYVIPFKFFVYKAMPNPFLNFVKKTIWRVRAEYLTRKATTIIEKAVDMKSIDVIHTNLSRDLLGGILAERNRIPHVWYIQELFKAHYQLSFLRNNQVEWMSKHADRFIAISKTVAKDWIENGLPDNKVSIVCNGIDLSSIESKDGFDTDETIRIVMVGHLVPAKGQEMVIERISKLPDEIRRHITLDCIGDGTEDYKKKLVDSARNKDVSLTLKGYREDVGKLLKEYDIGISSSLGEGFGLSTVEYMAAGICPVVANTGANEEIIINGQNGFVFENDRDESLTEIIEYLYYHRDRLSAAAIEAKKDASLNYLIEDMQKNVYAIYGDIMKRK